MIDYHVHLEEGPYSFRWLERTAQALQAYEEDATDKGYRQNVERQVQLLSERLQKGCYSEEWLDLYLQQAKRLGLREVGIVDHLYRFKETRAYFERYMELDEQHEYGSLQRYWLERVMTENIDEFIETIQQAKEKWHEQGVTLKLGVEADYFIGGEEELAALLDGHPWDFVIGSVHFVDGWGFDNPQTEYIFKRMDEAVLKKHYQRFFETVEGMIASNLFDFVAHLDNFKVFNYKVQDKVFLDTAYKRIAKALIATNTATEINAGLYYRYPVKEMCPSPRFLQTLLAYGVEFTVSSDAHFPDDLGKFTFENAQQLKNAGVSSLVTFNQREKQYIEIE
ncbi:histidinol phosphate phosphatase domain-containing protein [Metasolibacillus sp.]|uniref:histidinol phosphate phosphatase domain-containing protein n=1 Tax=Metasolibacillus sp. TaxID=2703680 RepID=UPI0026002438|nr:histidinol phosphate phosphatase domain-containing protein [Metasolibacillus sp.]MCT6924722.1 histidinol phosphate phosphatase domain-containing protein [Metasolibacillus sp.]MCT6940925.1 histidinol phosphate phosphatase domain-containing protein [Metasolibacillus sp.]